MPVDQLKGTDSLTHLIPRQRQQVDGRLWRSDLKHGRALNCRLGKQLDGRGRDDAQRALCPDQKVAQIIAGVVLSQSAEPMPDLTIRQHRLKPKA